MTKKEQRNAYMKAWYKRNPEKRKDHDRKAYKKFRQNYIDNAARWRKANPVAYKINATKHRNNNPEKHKGYALKYRYGITYQEYTMMLAQQDNKCAVCHEMPSYTLSVEHCHKTGKVRGLVCQRCNLAIGFMEQAGLVENISAYLKRFH